MNFLTHLSRMGAMPSHHVRTNLDEFVDLVTPENVHRLADLKICFLSGADNAVWLPDATKKSYDMLGQLFLGGSYERALVRGYGHLDCWMGKDAYNDVYPRIEHHIRSSVQALVKEVCDGIDMSIVDDGFVNVIRQSSANCKVA